MSKIPDLSKMDLSAIIALFNGGTRTDAVWERLDRLTEGRSVLRLAAGGNLDVGAAEKALGFSKRTGQSPPNHKSAVALRAELTKETDEADPLTGEALFEGVAPSGADWMPVSKDDRAAVALGVLQQEPLLRARTSEEVIHALATGAPPSKRLRDAWAVLDKDSETAARVRARLIVKPTAPEVPAPSPFVGSAEPMPGAPAPGIASARAGAGPLVLVLSTDVDRSAFDDLTRNAIVLSKAHGVRFEGHATIRAGQVRRNMIAGWMREAAAVVVLVSSDALGDDEITTGAEDAIAMGKKVIPTMLRPCLAFGTISRLTALPRSKPISQFSSKEDGWLEVVKGLRQVLGLG